MTADQSSRIPLDELRRAFESLGLQQKAEFILEAAFTTLASGVETAARTFSSELDEMFASCERARHEPHRRPTDESAPGAAEAASPPSGDE